MGEPTIQERVANCLADNLDLEREDVTPEANLRDDLGIDSLSAVEAAMALEEEFELEAIPVDEFEKAKTVQDITDYISGLLTGPEPATLQR